MKKLVIDDYEICLKIIAGNGHFRDTNFQKFLGEHAPRPPRQLARAFGARGALPLESPGSAPVFLVFAATADLNELVSRKLFLIVIVSLFDIGQLERKKSKSPCSSLLLVSKIKSFQNCFMLSFDTWSLMEVQLVVEPNIVITRI